MEVHHDEAQRKFWVEVDGFKADMSYHLKEGIWTSGTRWFRKRLAGGE